MHDSNQPNRPHGLSNLQLERYLLGELPADEMKRIDALAENLRERLRLLRESNAAVLNADPAEDFVRRLRTRMEAEQRKQSAQNAQNAFGNRAAAGTEREGAGFFAVFPSVRGPLWAGLGVAAVLLITAIPAWKTLRSTGSHSGTTVAASPEDRGESKNPAGGGNNGAHANAGEGPHVAAEGPDATAGKTVDKNGPQETVAPMELAFAPEAADALEETRIKGLEPRLAIFRRTSRGAEPMHPGEKARPGEFLRIGYHAGGFGYGAIFSVDGNGNVTRHWPATGAKAARLERGEALLPTAFELDAAPDFERFYLVVSPRPFALDPLLESLHRAAESSTTPPPPEHAQIVRFDVLKDTGI